MTSGSRLKGDWFRLDVEGKGSSVGTRIGGSMSIRRLGYGDCLIQITTIKVKLYKILLEGNYIMYMQKNIRI